MASGWLKMKELHLAIWETGSVSKGEGRKGIVPMLFPFQWYLWKTINFNPFLKH